MIEVVDVKEYAGFKGRCGNCQQWLRSVVEVEKRAHQQMGRVKLGDIRERRFAVNYRHRNSRRGNGGVRESTREKNWNGSMHGCHLSLTRN
jgi:hypothetical protein